MRESERDRGWGGEGCWETAGGSLEDREPEGKEGREGERPGKKETKTRDQGGTHLSFCLPGPYFHICEMGIKPSCLTAP